MPQGPDGSHHAAPLLLAALPCLLLSGVQAQSLWSNPGAASLLTYIWGWFWFFFFFPFRGNQSLRPPHSSTSLTEKKLEVS